MADTKRYDVALSFAGEARKYVEGVARSLRRRKMSVFYDAFETVDLWGKNLLDHLSHVYSEQADFVVMFISKEYVEKYWPSVERESFQAADARHSREYILPVRFDDTPVPGLNPATAYLEHANYKPTQLADLIAAKIRLVREQELKFAVAVRVDGQAEVFGFRTKADRDSFVEEIRDTNVEWAIADLS